MCVQAEQADEGEVHSMESKTPRSRAAEREGSVLSVTNDPRSSSSSPPLSSPTPFDCLMSSPVYHVSFFVVKKTNSQIPMFRVLHKCRFIMSRSRHQRVATLVYLPLPLIGGAAKVFER